MSASGIFHDADCSWLAQCKQCSGFEVDLSEYRCLRVFIGRHGVADSNANIKLRAAIALFYRAGDLDADVSVINVLAVPDPVVEYEPEG